MGPVSHMKAWLLGGATLVAGLGLSAVLYTALRSPEPVAGSAPPAVDVAPSLALAPSLAPAPVSETVAAPDPEPESATEPQGDTPPAPSFDVVRVAEDGGTLVAGSAVPGAAVVLRVDGLPVAETAADNTGQFVAIFTLAPTDAVQIMTLEMVLADGRASTSDDRVVLAPRPEIALALAEAAPEVTSIALAAVGPDTLSAPAPIAETPVPALGQGHEASAPVLEGGDLAIGAEASDAVTVGDAPAAPVSAPPPTEYTALPATPPSEPSLTTQDAAPGMAPETMSDPAATADAHSVNGEDTPAASAEAAAGTAAEPTPDSSAQTVAEPEIATDTTAEATVEPAAPMIAESITAQTATEPALPEAGESPLPRAFVLRGSGAVELLDRAPQVMDNVVIDVIAYSAQGDVQISGRAARSESGASVQIYLDNRPIAVARADNGDWASDLPAINPGIYTLRVDQLTTEGRVVSRFETPFQREDPAVVVAAQAQAASTATTPEEAPGQSDSEVSIRPMPDDATTEQVATDPVDAEPVATETAIGIQASTHGAEAEEAAVDESRSVAPLPASVVPHAAASPAVALVTVQPGHSLWRISEGHYGAGERYLVIYRANRSQIRNPDLIYPGQVFVLPD